MFPNRQFRNDHFGTELVYKTKMAFSKLVVHFRNKVRYFVESDLLPIFVN